MATTLKHLDLGPKVNLCVEGLVLHNGRALMFKRSENSRHFPGVWVDPGGHIDEGEDPMTAIIREIFEETGVKVGPENVKLKAISTHYHHNMKETYLSFIFLAKIPDFQEAKKDDVEGQSEWIPIRKLLSMKKVFPPSKYYFDHVLNDTSGIMYVHATWNNGKLVKVNTKLVDLNG